MKKVFRLRKVRPQKGSRQKEREGVRGAVEFYQEGERDLEFEAEFGPEDVIKPPLERAKDYLSTIIEYSNKVVPEIPMPPSGNIVIPQDCEIDEFSPVYFALRARQGARHAQINLEEGNWKHAIWFAMKAVEHYEAMMFARDYEPLVARELASRHPLQPSDKRRPWAVDLADKLVSENPELNFPSLWRLIPKDDESGNLGLDVYRDGDSLRASPETKGTKTISKETFRTNYIFPKKKEVRN